MISQILKKTLEDFCARPRQKSRAKCHLIDINRYDVLRTTPPKDFTGLFDAKNKFILESIGETLQDEAQDLKRGDLVFVLPYVNVCNYGKLIWTGEEVIPLTYVFGDDEYARTSDYGGVPYEFEVIMQFPINYWKDALQLSTDRNMALPFRFKDRLPNATTESITTSDGRYIFQLRDIAGQMHYIFDTIGVEGRGSPEEFLEELKEHDYFRNYADDFSLPINISPEHVLIVPE